MVDIAVNLDQLITFLSEHFILASIWAAIVILIVYTTIRMKLSPIKQLTTQELAIKVNRENALVVDIRSADDFKKGHIVDAKHLPQEKITSKNFASLESYQQNPIIVVCASGISAQKAADALTQAGFAQVHLLKGGMSAWTSAGLPVTNK